MRDIFVVLILAIASPGCNCQDIGNTTFHGTLSQALLLVDQTFHVPVLGEIVDPIPSNISLNLSSANTAPAALKTIVAQCPGYLLVRTDRAFVVAQKELFEDPANPMNEVLRDFEMPNDLGLFKLRFPNDVAKAHQGMHGFGYILNGAGLPQNLSPLLKEEVLHSETAREILLHVANEVGNLFSILILPSSHPIEQMLTNTWFRAWEIAGGPGMTTYTTWLRGYPDSSDQD